jgi:prolyl 4-hydroxylase
MGKKAGKRGKPDGSSSTIYMVGGAIAVVAIFLMSSTDDPTSSESSDVLPRQRKPIKAPVPMSVTFSNPSEVSATLFAAGGVLIEKLPPQASKTLDTMSQKKFYFSKDGKTKDHVVVVDELQSSYGFRANCKNIHENCEAFAHSCKTDPGWMSVHCPITCNVCHLQDPKVRCDRKRLNTSDVEAVPSGAIDKLFRNLKTDYPDYGVEILSSPDHEKPGPWIATFETFTTEEEIEAILKTTGNFQRSTDQGSVDKETGVQEMVESTGRTSENTWCRGECEKHPLVRQLMSKISRVIKVPEGNFENFQVLKYQLNQYYETHHDANPGDYHDASGHRIYTMFLYFSDVEEGGETDFPNLGISVKPKRGKALLWPSLVDSDVSKIDYQTKHQAKPVIKGLKYAANVWAHQHDYQIANVWGCTGSFNT